jgi:hypothetical protein
MYLSSHILLVDQMLGDHAVQRLHADRAAFAQGFALLGAAGTHAGMNRS